MEQIGMKKCDGMIGMKIMNTKFSDAICFEITAV